MDSTTVCSDCSKEISLERDGLSAYNADLCSSCKDKWQRSGEDQEEWRKKKERVENFEAVSPHFILNQNGVPSKIAKAASRFRLDERGFVGEEFPADPAIDSIYIYGPTGTGKTVLAAAFLYHALHSWTKQGKRWNSAYFVSIPDLLAEIRRTFSRGSDEDAEAIVMRYRTASILVLDDLGADKGSEWSWMELYRIISHRENREAITIFTSNLSLRQLADKSGDERIPSRIHGWAKKIRLAGEDFRGRF